MTPVFNILTALPSGLPSGRAAFPQPGYLHRAVVSFLAIGSLMLVSNSILLLSSWCDSVLAFAAFTALVLACLPPRGNLRQLVFAAFHLGAMYALLRIGSVELRVAALSWLMFSLEFTGRDRPRQPLSAVERSGLMEIHWAGLAYSALLVVYSRTDAVWFALRDLTEVLPGATHHGAWILGVPVYAIGLVSVVAGAATHPTGKSTTRLVLAGALLGAGVPLGNVILGALSPVGDADVSLLQIGAVVVVAAVVAGIRRERITPGARAAVAAVSLTLTAGIMVTTLSLGAAAGQGRERTSRPGGAGFSGVGPSDDTLQSAGLFSEGLLDWEIPDQERLGLAHSGMFGLLRGDLEVWMSPAEGRRDDGRTDNGRSDSGRTDNGRNVAILDSLLREKLSCLDLLVVINPSRCPSRDEAMAVEEFVRNGNSLLVLGDHTDIGHSREPLNTVLGFTGIRFNYDSAVPLRERWHECLEIRRHSVTSGIAQSEMLQVGIGASLEVDRRVTPLVVARYGYSDSGDPTNGGRGGNMGNVVQERGERVGGLVLAACEEVGAGRVLVFGDTSPFQNAALFLSHVLVRNSITWLCQDIPQIPCGSTYRYITAGRPGAILDFSLRPDLSLEPFTDRSLGGLANCLARFGLTPIPALESSHWERAAPFLMLINPTVALGPQRTEWTIDYMMSGGNVILARGYSDPQPVSSLISRFGLAIESMPLGGGDSTSSMSHKDAWAISLGAPEETEILSRAFGYPTVVTLRVGEGSLTLIADGRVLLDGSLESEWSGNIVNIGFVCKLLKSLVPVPVESQADVATN